MLARRMTKDLYKVICIYTILRQRSFVETTSIIAKIFLFVNKFSPFNEELELAEKLQKLAATLFDKLKRWHGWMREFNGTFAWFKLRLVMNFGQEINFPKSIHFDSESHIKSGQHFRFSKVPTYFEHLPLKISLLDFSVTYTFIFKMIMSWWSQPISCKKLHWSLNITL